MEVSRAKGLGDRVKILSRLRPKDFTPVPPALKEPTTGLTMGESAEQMAQKNGISRAAQDELAWQSHARAAAAWDAGKFDAEVMHVPVPPRYDRVSARDNIVRKDTTRRRRSRSSARCSIAATARSPPGTPRRSPTAPPRSS